MTTLQVTEPVKRRRGRPPGSKNKPKHPTVEVMKKRRGRPPKSKVTVSNNLVMHKEVNPKRRGRPPKRKVKEVVSSKTVAAEPVDKDTAVIQRHSFYPAAQWILEHIPPEEEAYLKRSANKHGLTVLNNILEHMLGYFSIRGSELGQAIRNTRKQNTDKWSL